MASRTASAMSYRSAASSNVPTRHPNIRQPLSAAPSSASAPAASQIPHMLDRVVKNLRLLNLATLEDYPQITPDLFSNANAVQNQKSRIRAVEWVLFRLFQLWSPVETREKLQQFFPPFESLQSINLRSALFRSLGELKQQQILPRDLILRKSMLDDCKGEKVVEILLSFSTAVLKMMDSSDTTLASDLAVCSKLTAQQKSTVIPLTLIYKHAFSNLVHEKEKQNKRFKTFQDQCADDKRIVDARLIAATERLESLAHEEEPLSSADLTNLRGKFQSGLKDDSRWLDVIFHADKNNTQDQRFNRQWPEMWDELVTGEQGVQNVGSVGLLEKLQLGIREQERGVARLEGAYSEMQRSFTSIKSSLGISSKSRATPSVRFTRHQELNIRQQSKGTAEACDRALPECYEQILGTLRTSSDVPIPSARRLHIPVPSSDPQLPRRYSVQKRERQLANGLQHNLLDRDSSHPPPQPSTSSFMSPTKSGRFPIRAVPTSAAPLSSASTATSMTPRRPDRGLRPLSLVSSSPSKNIINDMPSTSSIISFPSLMDAPDLSYRPRTESIIQNESGVLTLSERTRRSMSFKAAGILSSPKPRRKESHVSAGTEWDPNGSNSNSILEEDGESEEGISTITPPEKKAANLVSRTRLSMSGVNWGVPGSKAAAARRQSIKDSATGLFSKPKPGSFTSRQDYFDEESLGPFPEKEHFNDPEQEEGFKSRPRVAMSPVGSPRMVVEDDGVDSGDTTLGDTW